MIDIKRGEIWNFESGGEFGRELYGDRPVVIISPADVIERYGVVCIVPLSTTLRDGSVHVIVKSSKYPSIAMCEQMKTVDVSRLKERFGCVTDIELRNIEESIKVAAGIENQAFSELMQEVSAGSEKLNEALIQLDVYKRLYNELLERVCPKG